MKLNPVEPWDTVYERARIRASFMLRPSLSPHQDVVDRAKELGMYVDGRFVDYDPNIEEPL
jgi:hypothetical protein